MKVALTIFLITGFLGIAAFGAFAMNHGDVQGHNGCIAATANGQPCPVNDNILQSLTFHLNALQSFSTATLGNTLAGALLLYITLLFAASLLAFARINPAPPILVENYRRRQSPESSSFPFQRALIHWLALHENSPTVS